MAPPTAPGALPLLGHALPLLRSPLPFLASLPALGDLVRIRLGPQHVYVACTPELTRRVLLEDSTFDKGGLLFDRARETLGNGLGTCPHRDHRRQRQLIQPAFHPERLPRYGQVMTEQITAVTRSWQQGQVIDVLADMQQITARTLVATMLADARLTGVALTEMIDDLHTFQAAFYRRMFMPPPLDRLPTPGNRRYVRAGIRLRASLSRIIAEYRAAGTDHGDLLSALLAARDSHSGDATGQGMSDGELTDQIITFSFAGTETTAALLAWALHLVARHPGVEEALHREADGVLAGAAATVGDLPRLEVTGRILTETLRLYPPGYLLTRTTTRPTELGGHLLPAGATVAYSPYVIHHRPDLYPDPERFDPDRWKDGGTARTPRGTLVPFAAGPRKCIGDTFAITEATLALATIATRWRLEPVSGTPVRPALGSTLTPQGLHMLATPRRQGP
ncbi:cytochrome P450 [Streptomyces sp. NPDC059909]|uniref:cytochrome P450 n=1 Tax=Streptomyces sp. NPDC059909 TaxID=3346998 RepID=UPI00364D3D5B